MISEKVLFLCFLFITSCGSHEYKSRTVENYYQSAGIEKYFLSEIPAWANFSERAACFKNSAIHYFDLDQLMKNLNYDYQTAISLQGTFNEEFEHYQLNVRKDQSIPFLDLQNIFYRSQERVSGKIHFFEAPTYSRINLVWIDSMLKGSSEEKKIREFLKSPIFDEGVPVLVSLCMTKREIEAKFPTINYHAISAEMFSIYDPKGEKAPIMRFYFDQFFKNNQSLYFYSHEKIQTSNEFIGKLKFFSF